MTLPVRSTSSIVTSNPVYYAAKDVVGKTLGLTGSNYTEEDLTKEQLAVIDNQVRYRLKNTPYNSIYFGLHPNDTIRMGINAPKLYPEMYGRKYCNTELPRKLKTPDGQVETTLGNYNFKVFKDGYEVNDTYDFNVGQGLYKGDNSIYARARRFMGEYGHKDTDDDKGKAKFKIKRYVTHW